MKDGESLRQLWVSVTGQEWGAAQAGGSSLVRGSSSSLLGSGQIYDAANDRLSRNLRGAAGSLGVDPSVSAML